MARFLFVADSDLVGPRVVELLRGAGWIVDAVKDPYLALDCAEGLEYDGVIFDLWTVNRTDAVGAWLERVYADTQVPHAILHGSVGRVDETVPEAPPARWRIDKALWGRGTFNETVLRTALDMLRTRVRWLQELAGDPRTDHGEDTWVDTEEIDWRLATHDGARGRRLMLDVREARSPQEAVFLLNAAGAAWDQMLPTERFVRVWTASARLGWGFATPPQERRAWPEMADHALRLEAASADPRKAALTYLGLATARHGWRWRLNPKGDELVSAGPIPTRAAGAWRPRAEFADGWRVYLSSGMVVPQRVIDAPETYTVEEVRRQRNSELRRILQRQIGDARWLELTGASLVDVDTVPVDLLAPGGKHITRALVEDADGQRFLVASDGSTRRVYHMPVPDVVETCKSAYEALSGRIGARTIIQA